MVKIFHNPKCSKSREGLEILKSKVDNFEIIDYMKTGISISDLKEVIALLNITPIDLVRTNEVVWKENFKDKNLTDEEIIKAMKENPKLIQRPIIINNNKAVIGRPVEIINSIL